MWYCMLPQICCSCLFLRIRRPCKKASDPHNITWKSIYRRSVEWKDKMIPKKNELGDEVWEVYKAEWRVRLGIWKSCIFPNFRNAGRLLCRAYTPIKCYHLLPVSTDQPLSCTQSTVSVSYLYLVWTYRLLSDHDDPYIVFEFVLLST
jgi:hypothetical protein